MSMEINEMQEMNERAKKALEYHKKDIIARKQWHVLFVRSLEWMKKRCFVLLKVLVSVWA